MVLNLSIQPRLLQLFHELLLAFLLLLFHPEFVQLVDLPLVVDAFVNLSQHILVVLVQFDVKGSVLNNGGYLDAFSRLVLSRLTRSDNHLDFELVL